MSITSQEIYSAAVRSGLVDGQTAEQVRQSSRRERRDPVEALASAGRVPQATLYRAVADLRGLSYSDLAQIQPDAETLGQAPAHLLQRYELLPLTQENGQVQVACIDPDNAQAFRLLERAYNKPIVPVLCAPDQLRQARDRYVDRRHPAASAGVSAQPVASGTVLNATDRLNHIVYEAYLRRASDIHLLPCEDGLQVRVRTDGVLADLIHRMPHEEGLSLVSRVKVLAGLNIAEQRAPQDGGFSHRDSSRPEMPGFDIRVATLATRWGERVTMRLLEKNTQVLTLDALGMAEDDLDRFDRWIHRPHGMILITGPTGSGKSTTLYAALRRIVSPKINIMTVEDPIEQTVESVSQVQVDPQGEVSKVDFPKALRSLLRHDPDVLMIGEIRDRKTAEIAIRAALTGHLVFSTLHTNHAAAAITRLADLGIEPFLIGATLLGTMAQRLVRRLCPNCSSRGEATAEERLRYQLEEGQAVYTAAGCARCMDTGYRGRLGVFELLSIDPGMARVIASGGGEQQVLEEAQNTYRTLADDGKAKALAGMTSLDEVKTLTQHLARGDV